MLKILHGVAHALVIFFICLGIYSAVRMKNVFGHNDMYSSHSWYGVLTIALFFIEFAFGLVTFATPAVIFLYYLFSHLLDHYMNQKRSYPLRRKNITTSMKNQIKATFCHATQESFYRFNGIRRYETISCFLTHVYPI